MASVIFGIITGRLGDVLVFLFFYGTLRSFSGGVHCKSKAGCFCLSMAILLIPIYTSEWIMGIVNTPVLIIIGIMAVVTILILSPVESINKPLDDQERRFYGSEPLHCCIAGLYSCIPVLLGQNRIFLCRIQQPDFGGCIYGNWGNFNKALHLTDLLLQFAKLNGIF